METNSSKLIIASLKSGKDVTISLRDFLVVQQYAESVGLNLEVMKRFKRNVTVKAK